MNHREKKTEKNWCYIETINIYLYFISYIFLFYSWLGKKNKYVIFNLRCWKSTFLISIIWKQQHDDGCQIEKHLNFIFFCLRVEWGSFWYKNYVLFPRDFLIFSSKKKQTPLTFQIRLSHTKFSRFLSSFHFHSNVYKFSS
jgi:hypothetical protein